MGYDDIKVLWVIIINDVIEFLEDYIWKNGFEKLSENPFAIYKDMVKSKKKIVALSPKLPGWFW